MKTFFYHSQAVLVYSYCSIYPYIKKVMKENFTIIVSQIYVTPLYNLVNLPIDQKGGAGKSVSHKWIQENNEYFENKPIHIYSSRVKIFMIF